MRLIGVLFRWGSAVASIFTRPTATVTEVAGPVAAISTTTVTAALAEVAGPVAEVS